MLKSMKTLSVTVMSGGGGGGEEEAEERGFWSWRERELERKRRERRGRWSFGWVGEEEGLGWWCWERRGEEERVVEQPMMTTVLHGGDWRLGSGDAGGLCMWRIWMPHNSFRWGLPWRSFFR